MIRWIKRIFLFLLGFLLVASLVLWILGYGYLFRGVQLTYLKGYSSANIYDGQDFDTRLVPKKNTISALQKSANYNKTILSPALQNMLFETSSTSFMVIKNDSIIYEKYFLTHADTTRVNSFSMAKTITALLVQMAIEDGRIPNWETKVKNYLPWLEGQYATELTLRNLSNMTAGLDWEESYYNPFGITAEAYYGRDIEKTMHKVKVVSKPGKEFVYQSGATQLLGLCLKKALGKPLSVYASEKLWIPMGAELDATWHTDRPGGTELSYCCFNAIARDFARIGEILLHHGRWNNHHFVDSNFVATMKTPFLDDNYGQALWLGKSGKTIWSMFQGTLGQYIILVPEKNTVIVRTGNAQKKGKQRIPDCAQTYVDELLKSNMLN